MTEQDTSNHRKIQELETAEDLPYYRIQDQDRKKNGRAWEPDPTNKNTNFT